MKNLLSGKLTLLALCLGSAGMTTLAVVVPNEAQMPGTQPLEAGPLEAPSNCAGCHGNYDSAVEPWHSWAGSMMAQAGRDPMFWAAMAIAEQSFDGSGDLCIRCHMPNGWIDGRSTPTDGSALTDADAQAAVSCDACHNLTNPDGSEHSGIQNAPFIANDGGVPAEAYVGSGQYVLYSNAPDKLGPYAGVSSPHGVAQSQLHRDPAMCGTCHDVSNPVTGDLAPGNGAMTALDPADYDGTLGGPLADKAAFNNMPHTYGVVERTYSEFVASAWDETLVSDYPDLPWVLQTGIPKTIYEVSLNAGTGGNYEDGTDRYYTCQSCHMQPVTGIGCIIASPTRDDLPLHDFTGSNYWMQDAIQYLDGLSQLRLGNGLTAAEEAAMDDAQDRARIMLDKSARIYVAGNTLYVVNLSGHKLLSGYPDGRRMWVNVRWYDSNNNLLREDGEYGLINVTINGSPAVVDSIIDLADPYLRIYEAHLAITQEWADELVNTIGASSTMPVAFDRLTGAVTKTLGDIEMQSPGTHFETFNFVLNNEMVSDNRIPPYGYSYDEAVERNAQPVPDTQYGDPGPGGIYNFYDKVPLSPPTSARKAKIRLMMQPTSWEYIQYLDLANDGSVTFLANEGDRMLDAWLNTGMAEPHVMAQTIWRPLDGTFENNPSSKVPTPTMPSGPSRPLR